MDQPLSDSFPAHSWSCWGLSPLLISLSLSQLLLLKGSACFSQNFSDSLQAWRGKHAFWLCVGPGLLSRLFQLFYKHKVRMKTWAFGVACGALADLLPLPLQPGFEVHLPCLSGLWRLCSGPQTHHAPSMSDPRRSLSQPRHTSCLHLAHACSSDSPSPRARAFLLDPERLSSLFCGPLVLCPPQ